MSRSSCQTKTRTAAIRKHLGRDGRVEPEHHRVALSDPVGRRIADNSGRRPLYRDRNLFRPIASHHRNNGGEIGLIWFDAHADINTPETSMSGNIHGMPLAAILGHGQQDLINLCGYAPKLNAKYLAHVGARDVDEGERMQIEKLGPQ
jgi:hypothetical protein